MCLRLKYAEARLWKNRARDVINKAKAAAAESPCDPLLIPNPRLSSLVSEIDSIKKRHGLLIEDALIYAINRIPAWWAGKEKIPVAGGRAHLDCLAYNARTKLLYVFECKRGHGTFDSDKTSAIDARLDRIKAAVSAYSMAKGWSPMKEEVFILSFYGTKWKSKYRIYNRHDIATLFEPCLGTFVDHFMRHVEHKTNAAYLDELRDSPNVSGRQQTIFEQISDEGALPEFEIEFSGNGADLVSTQPH
jgi:hypothetical protein